MNNMNKIFGEKILLPPIKSSEYIKKFIDKIRLNPSSFAKTLGVSSSTVKRYFDGGSLTVSLAAKMYVVHGIDPEILFLLDAKHLSNSAKVLSDQLKKEKGPNECTVNAVANFGAWLVNNHESEFSGGEDQIAKLCSDFIDQHK